MRRVNELVNGTTLFNNISFANMVLLVAVMFATLC